MDIYHKRFSRVYIFSPSINVVHQTWQPVKDTITKEITNNDDEQFFFDHYNEEALLNIINTFDKVDSFCGLVAIKLIKHI